MRKWITWGQELFFNNLPFHYRHSFLIQSKNGNTKLSGPNKLKLKGNICPSAKHNGKLGFYLCTKIKSACSLHFWNHVSEGRKYYYFSFSDGQSELQREVMLWRKETKHQRLFTDGASSGTALACDSVLQTTAIFLFPWNSWTL